MNNNGESIKKYNELLIKYLNDLVNGINPNNDINGRLIDDVVGRFKKQLVTENLDISDAGVKTLMTNAFNQYINILKNHFDHSNIHRIDMNLSNSPELASEFNNVTSNLATAVSNINKIPEYINLINNVKVTLITYFKQAYPNRNDVEFISEQIINDCIGGVFSNLAKDRIDDFVKYTLPTLYSIGDSITYSETKQIDPDDNINVMAERDEFIRSTMDLEIVESMENGVLTLSITDPTGKTNKYFGRDAMERLASYNQLFEASRPGRKVDISHWANSVERNVYSNSDNGMNNNSLPDSVNMMDNNPSPAPSNDSYGAYSASSMNNNSPLPDSVNMMDNNPMPTPSNGSYGAYSASSMNSNSPLPDSVNMMDNNPMPTPSNGSYGAYSTSSMNSNSPLPDSVNMMDNNPMPTPSNDSYGAYNTSGMNNMPTNQTFDNLVDEGNEEIKKMIFTDNTQKEENRPITNSIDVNKLSAIINEDTTIDSSAMGRLNNMMANNFESNSNNSNNNINNNFKSFNDTEEVTHSDDLKQIRSMMGIEDDTVSNLRFGNDFSFVPQFSNPNEERDAFINKITGIVLEEDVDNKGLLYLKITEPTGREEIYTGKHAVEMIKNFNKAYLDANPGKEVDTSLIDNFKEN